MAKTDTQITLDKFKEFVIQQSRSRLTKAKKNSSKNLYNSIKGEVKHSPNSIQLFFSMEDYGTYQDRGVKGMTAKGRSNGGEFSFRKGVTSSSMMRSLDKWIVRKGIAPRDAKGNFISRKSLKFAIARSIFNNGIKPTLFFTKPFEQAFKKLPNELVESYGLDVIELLDKALNIQGNE